MSPLNSLGIPARALLILFLLLSPLPALQATVYTVSPPNFSSSPGLPATLQPGDEIRVESGTYVDIDQSLIAAGTALNPVRMYPVAADGVTPAPGTVYFSGETRFTLKGSQMVISGFAFDGDVAAGGPKYPSGLFRLDPDSSDYTLRDILVRNFDTGADASGVFWIQLNGYRHTVEYCSFIGKDSEDPIINIIPPEDENAGDLASKDTPRCHLLRHCYFGERTNIGLNGYEAIRIGESQYQMYDMSTTVEYCVFERAIYGPNISNYEPEIISSKSRNNIYRYNTFIENKGGLVLRHGDDNVVEGNFFFGIPKPAVPVTPPAGELEIEKMGAGLRIIGLRHIVRNNYFEGIHGTNLRAAICLMKGSGEFGDDSTSNGYESPGTARIFHNTVVNCEQPFALGAITSSSGTSAPNNVEIRNNVIQSDATNGDVIYFNSNNGWNISQIAFSGNQAYHPSGNYGPTVPASGFATGTPVNLVQDAALGFQIPQAGSPAINAASATAPVTVTDIRSMLRSGPSDDAGSFDSEGTATSFNRPLVQADVGPVFDGPRNDPERVPSLLVKPIGQDVFEGDPVSFSVTAESSQAVSYQWLRDGVPIPGATASSYAIGAAAVSDAASYVVAVTNASGRTLSYPAILTVTAAAPVIITQPSSQVTSIGGNVTFTVVAAGIGPFSYQWRLNSVPIGGATSASIALSNVQTTDAGNYSVVVTNANGSATSMDAALSVSGANIIVNDNFSDVDRTQTGPLDADWWSSNSTSGNSIEIDAAGLGMVTGTSGRGIHATFANQTLAVGEKLTATFSFTTPATVGTNRSGAFKVALMDLNDPNLAADLSSSSSNVNPIYTNFPGYMADFDIATGTENIRIYEHNTPNTSGRFLGTTGEWTAIGGSATNGYVIAANTAYVGGLSLSRTGADTMDIFSSLSQGATLLDSHSETDLTGIANNFGVLGFWANSNTFGSTNSSSSDNGLTFTSVTIERCPIPALSPLESWRSTYFGTTANAGTAANDFDADCDGIPNLIEYLFGLDPTVPDAEGAVTAGTEVVGGNEYLTITFQRDLSATGVSHLVRAGDQLSTWANIDPDGANQVSSSTAGSIETITVRDNVPLGGTTRRFMQLMVTES